MERQEWLKEKRRLTEERMNTLFAPVYDEDWGASISPTHGDCLHKFLAQCPARCTILDAACGTGKYWPLILASGRSVLGLDQSLEMLNRARAKFPDTPTQKQALQEISDQCMFDGIVCIDAMEYVPPEDWPLVLGNFHRALKPGGFLYVTVELADADEVQADFEMGRQMGLPLVHGESAHEDGYHYYPSIDRVRNWLSEVKFALLDERVGDDYHHFLVRR